MFGILNFASAFAVQVQVQIGRAKKVRCTAVRLPLYRWVRDPGETNQMEGENKDFLDPVFHLHFSKFHLTPKHRSLDFRMLIFRQALVAVHDGSLFD